MDFREQIKSNIGNLLNDRIRDSQLHQLELRKIAQGVVFVFAPWSGASIVSLRLLCEALSAGLESTFPVFLMNIDTLNLDVFKSKFGELPQGKGETYWIKGGEILFRDHGYNTNTSRVLPERIALLSLPD